MNFQDWILLRAYSYDILNHLIAKEICRIMICFVEAQLLKIDYTVSKHKLKSCILGTLETSTDMQLESIFLSTLDDCCQLAFNAPITGKILVGHVINTATVIDVRHCRVLWYMEADCKSFNMAGVNSEGKAICELNQLDDIQHPENLIPFPGVSYHGTEVFFIKLLFSFFNTLITKYAK